MDLSSLNDNQCKAVMWQEGPLLVLAGPGSGKTRVLTYRISRLIEETAEKHFRILGLTFTNKAAAEMRERVEGLVPNARERILLTTFHSFCADMLRQHGHHIGLRPDFTILGQAADRQGVLDDAIAAVVHEEGQSTYTGERLLPLITRLLDLGVGATEAGNFLSSRKLKEPEVIGSIYAAYRGLMIDKNALDFGALIAETLRLMEEQTAVKKQIQRVYSYVCVDEFQDTNLSQYRVLSHLVNPRTKNLFVVADDDQIIYQWNGANPERLQALRKDFGMTVLQLPENYRCPAEVIDIANQLIEYNLNRSPDKEPLLAHKSAMKKSPILLSEFDDLDEETEWVASDIKRRNKNSWGKCAVLARTRRLLDQMVIALTNHEVPGYLAMRKDEFVCPAMQWLHATLRLANARQDREQLRRVCKAFYTLAGVELNVRDIVAAAAATEGDYLRAWRKSALESGDISSEAKTIVTRSIQKLADKLDFRTTIEDSLKWFDGLAETSHEAKESFLEYKDEKATWEDLVNDIDRQYGSDQVTLHLLLQELDLRSKTQSPPKHAVRCFTIHGAKGMEFDHVYLIGLVEDQLPSWAAIKKGDESREMQEERRNCFVAVTRTQETLTLTYSKKVFGWVKRPSRFLKEMGLVT
jgi:DNA helicase II / ATP-dependent DNA helicase PcrA